jgi:hypothetical protein
LLRTGLRCSAVEAGKSRPLTEVTCPDVWLKHALSSNSSRVSVEFENTVKTGYGSFPLDAVELAARVSVLPLWRQGGGEVVICLRHLPMMSLEWVL